MGKEFAKQQESKENNYRDGMLTRYKIDAFMVMDKMAKIDFPDSYSFEEAINQSIKV